MCHVKDVTFSVVAASPVAVQLNFAALNKSNSRLALNPFRKIAKSARVNLNKYWGLLSNKQRKSSIVSSTSSAMSVDVDFSAEEEQNRINELLESQANAEEQNSINSQIEYDSSPEPPRRHFVRQRAIASSYSSFASSTSSFCHHQISTDFQDTLSQDSVFF